MGVYQFFIDKKDLKAIQLNERSRSKRLDDLISQSNNGDESNYDYIKNELLNGHSHNSGSPDISELTVEYSTFNSISNRGKIEFSYFISFFYGCADYTKEKDCSETCKYTIDMKSKRLTLTIEEYEERSTIDEY